MSLNWKEINCILSELALTNGKIQQALQITPRQLYLEIYTAYQPHIHSNIPSRLGLFISLEVGEVRIHHTQDKFRKPKTAQRFQQLLQARVLGLTIKSVNHIHNDRIIQFELMSNHALEDGDDNSNLESEHDSNEQNSILNLYIRLWNNHANVILTDTENNIIDLAFRKPLQNLMPGEKFVIEAPSQEHHSEIREWDMTHYTNFNQYINEYYKDKKQNVQSQNKYQQQLIACSKQIRQHEQLLSKIKNQLAIYEKHEDFMRFGNLILAHIDQISQGQKKLEIQEHINDSKEIFIIPLLEDMSPTKNAEHYFNKAKKAKRSLDLLHAQETELDTKLHQLKEIQNKLTENKELLSEEITTLNTNKNQENSIGNKDTKSSVLSEIKTKLQVGPYIIVIGRNAKENDFILRKFAKGNDVWLHIRGNSGSYVFIRAPKNKTISLDLLCSCGQLAAFFSKVKNESYTDVYYTEVKYLKKVKNSIGLVIPMRNKNLQIKIDIAFAKKYLGEHSLK